MATDFSPEKLKARFWELTDKYDEYEAKLAPLRKQLEKALDGTRKEEEAARAKIKKAREGLYELEMERAAVARALGGKTGAREA